MAIFLSRIKRALNLGTKSITQNGTYNASSDGYDGYSSVEVNVSGVTPTPITPSNSSPAQMTANTPVNPTANGYAISSYDSVTPSSIAHNVASGDIIKIGGTGIIISNIPTITPSNNNPVPLSAGNPVRPTISGYAIEGYSSRTPSDSSPASVLSGAIIKASANGYLYATQQPKVKIGTFETSTSTTTKITCGFKPKYIGLFVKGSGSTYQVIIYNGDYSTSYTYPGASNASGTASALPSTTNNRIASIDNDGFTVNKYTSSNTGTAYYFAIG